MFAPPGACVWGSHCRVPETQGHFCPVCSTSAHSTCTYTNVCAFAESQRARNSGADPASAELQYTVAVEEADTPGCPVCRNLPSLAAVVCRVSGSAGAGCGGSGARSVRTRATTSTSVPSGTPCRRTRASNKTVFDALGQVASGRKRKRTGLDDGVDITDSFALRTVALANPEPTTTSAPTTESTTAEPLTGSSETVATPPFDYDNTNLGAAVPPCAPVSEDSIPFVSAGATTADGTGKTASDTGLSAAGACTSRSSTLSVFDNLRALLLKVVICCGCARFDGVLIFCVLRRCTKDLRTFVTRFLSLSRRTTPRMLRASPGNW